MGKKHIRNQKNVRWYETWTFLILVCVVLPLSFRSLAFAPYHIPSGSMKPTLLIGDFILVNKSSYGYSRYSFPFGLPLFDGRIRAENTPARGDVVIFRPLNDPNTDFIKRVIGLPGDKVKMLNGQLYLNEVIVKRVPQGTFTDEDGSKLRHYVEHLPTTDGAVIRYDVLDEVALGPLDNTPEYRIPAGHYFMMGDNRDHSADSRTPHVGIIPAEHLVGKAQYIAFSASDNVWKLWRWFGGLFRGERLWLPIQYEEREDRV